MFVLGFYPLVYEQDSKYDVTRRERTSRESKRGEAMQAAMDRSRWGPGAGSKPTGKGLHGPRGGVLCSEGRGGGCGAACSWAFTEPLLLPPVLRQVKGKSSLASLTAIREAGTRKDLRDRSAKPRRGDQEVSSA